MIQHAPTAAADPDRRRGLTTYQAYAPTLRRFPGVIGSGWRSAEPARINVHTRGEGWSKLASNVLSDAVLGSRLAVASMFDDGTGAPPTTGVKPFWEDYAVMAQAVAALPHVIDWQWADYGRDHKYLVFSTDTEDAIKHLKPLVRPELAGFKVAWKVGTSPLTIPDVV